MNVSLRQGCVYGWSGERDECKSDGKRRDSENEWGESGVEGKSILFSDHTALEANSEENLVVW